MADAPALHRALIDALVSRGAIKDSRVETAFRAIPRHLFLPRLPLEEVYRDQAIPTKIVDGEAVSSASRAELMATMLERLGLEPGLRVLEIGAGTGYNAALMAHVVGETGMVTTMDVDADLVDGARAHLAAAGLDRIRVVLGDGGLRYPDRAPYHRIILTVGAWGIAPASWGGLPLASGHWAGGRRSARSAAPRLRRQISLRGWRVRRRERWLLHAPARRSRPRRTRGGAATVRALRPRLRRGRRYGATSVPARSGLGRRRASWRRRAPHPRAAVRCGLRACRQRRDHREAVDAPGARLARSTLRAARALTFRAR